MNVLLISNLFPNPAAPERGRMALEKIRALRDRHSFRVISPLAWFSRQEPKRDLEVPRHTTVDGIPVWYPRVPHVPVFGRRWLATTMRGTLRHCVRRLHNEQPVDVIWSTWGYPDVVAAVELARELELPVVAELHGSDVNQGLQVGWIRDALLRALECCRSVIVRSEAMRQALFHEGVAEEKLVCIYNGVDHTRFRPLPKAEACAQLGWTENRVRVVFVGLISEAKGTRDLLHAFAQIAKRTRHPVELVFAGFGPLVSQLQRDTAILKLQEKVRFLGRVPNENLPLVYNACDLLCLPSYGEGMPNVVLEAQACGLPVVASNVGAVPELIPDSRYGFLHEPGDRAMLAERLERALNWPFERHLIVEHSNQFSWERSAMLYDHLFRHAVGRAERPSSTLLRLAGPERVSFRVRFFSQSYPTPNNPIAGAFNRQIALALRRHLYLEMVVPVPRLRGKRAMPLMRWQDGLMIRHPRYIWLRGLNRLTAGCLLSRAIRARPCRAEILMASPAWPEGYAVVRRARECQRPCVVNVIGSDINRLPAWGPRRSQTIWALQNCDHIYAVSRALRDRLIALGVLAEKITVIHNGVNGRMFFPRPAHSTRRELNLPANRQIIMFAGNITAEKGVDDLLQAMTMLPPPRPLLLLIGPCPQKPSYLRLIQRHRLQQDCLLVSRQPQSQMPKWYAACDLFVLPSWHEGCPNVVLEALACGRPVVATHVGGIPELIDPSRMPFTRLVAPQNPSALACTIAELLAQTFEPDQIASLATRTWDDVGRDLNQLLRAVHARWLRQQAHPITA